MSTTRILLANNRPVRFTDYVTTFAVSKPTAYRMLKDDRKEARVKRLMVSHFIMLYDTAPRKFKPCYEEYEVRKIQ